MACAALSSSAEAAFREGVAAPGASAGTGSGKGRRNKPGSGARGGKKGGFSWNEMRKVKYNSYCNRMSSSDRRKVKQMLSWLRCNDKTEQDALRKLHVSRELYPQSMRNFCQKFMGHVTEDLKDHLIGLYPYNPFKSSPWRDPEETKRRAKLHRVLFKLYGEFVARDLSEQTEKYRLSAQYSDMRGSHMWYVAARSMERKLVYHAGPTNSGKTYQALQRLVRADTGVYCAPLRLLAAEGYDTMNRQGAVTDLVTGQEMKVSPFATHSACTVEMADLTKPIDVAVLDEIQMIADPDRGYAWTRALLGLPAREIHVCGDDSALELVQRFAKKMGEDLEVRRYERHKPLEVESEPLRDFGSVQPGDCLIAFSKKEIYRLKLEVESRTDYKCAIIYGNLPPETRRQQAELFNDPASEYKVLVATDAVGMGLNLSVRRIIFTKMEKYCGALNAHRTLSSSQVKQIAGRAGRRSSAYEKGLVSALNEGDMAKIGKMMGAGLKKQRLAGILPPYEQIEMFASLQPEEVVNNLGRLFRAFAKTAQLEDGLYFMCRTKDIETMGRLLTKFTEMSLEEKYKFVIAPIDTSNRDVVLSMLRYVQDFANREPVPVNVRLPSPRSETYLHKLENCFKILSLYLWLSLRFPDEFVEKDKAELLLEQCTHCIEEALEKLSPESVKQKRVLLEAYISSPRGRPFRIK